jgi:hypothetical protein
MSLDQVVVCHLCPPSAFSFFFPTLPFITLEAYYYYMKMYDLNFVFIIMILILFL